MDLTIVIVSWNVCDYLVNCLESIFQVRDDLDLEVFVIDNASSDETVEVIREKFPQANLVVNEKNVGFPKANNQGIELSSGEFVLLLNPDTVVFPGVLKACVDNMRSMPSVGALGCRLIYPDGKPQYEAGRRFPTLWDLLVQAFYLHLLFPKSRIFNGQLMGEWDHRDDREVDCLSGAFMMLRRSALNQVGFLDENIFMYFEDLEICYRLKTFGYKIYFLGSQEIIHIGARSSTKTNHKLWLLEGEVKSKIIELLYGQKAKLFSRYIIGIRSILRILLGIIFFIPGLIFLTNDNYRSSLNIFRNISLLQWSINPSILKRYFENKYIKNNI